MTICIATSNFPPQTGGIASFYGHLSLLLHQQGHHVVILMPDENAALNEEDEVLMKDGITKVLLRKKYSEYRNYYGSYFPPGGLNAPSWIAMGLAMKEWLQQNQQSFFIDIIEASDYGGIASFLSIPSLPPVVVTGHGSFTQLSRYNVVKNNLHSWLVLMLEKTAMQEAAAIIANSPQNKADLQNLTGRKIEFSTVPFEQLTPENNTPENGAVLVIGGLQKVKGAITTAEALRFVDRENNKIQINWVGGDTYTAPGSMKMSLYLEKTFPDSWNKKLVWLPEKTNAEVIELIAKAAIVLIPAEWETFNYVALEAASLHKAIIITNQTGASYLFTHGLDAWIIPANDPKRLADAILHLSANPELCQTLGQNAAVMVKNVFDKKAITEERIAIYRQTILNRQSETGSENKILEILEKITRPQRKLYFQLRATIKKWAGRK